jgi:hypothetical protein
MNAKEYASIIFTFIIILIPYLSFCVNVSNWLIKNLTEPNIDIFAKALLFIIAILYLLILTLYFVIFMGIIILAYEDKIRYVE